MGEFVASLAVVVSVIYLAIQLREQRNEVKRQAGHALVNAWSEFGKSFAENGDLASIWIRGLEDYAQLDRVEKVRFATAATRMLKNYESLYYLFLEDALEKELWETMEYTIAIICRSPGFSQYWSTRAPMFRPKFQALVGKWTGTNLGPDILQGYYEPAGSKVDSA